MSARRVAAAVALCVVVPSLGAQRPPAARGWPDGAWRQIGPAAFGGRVDDIEAVERDPRTIFVGTASGGVFRSRDDGTTWEAVFDRDGTALSIGDVAIAPSDENVVWVGTGEANGRQSSTWGDGVYRSLDGGTTWRNMGLTETQSIGRVVIDPRDPNVVFVAAVGHLWGPNEQRGLYRTRDGGTTWRKVLGVDENTGVVDVAMARDGRTLFAATYQRRRRAWGFSGGGPGGGLWRSLDGGETWTRLTNGLPGGVTGRIGIDIARSDENVVYAVIEHRAGGVFRSTDRGTTWTRQSRLNERPSYFSQIRVDPTDPERVWLLGTFLHSSADGGKAWTSDSTARGVHPDHHAMWIDPRDPRHILLGNDGGVWTTRDRARHWRYVDNLPIGQFYDIAVDRREPYWIYGGLQDQGTFAFPSATYSRGPLTDAQVTFIAYGDGFQVAPDPTDSNLVYANSQNGRGYVVNLATREEHRITPVPADRAERYRFNWNTAILVSPNAPGTYYYGAQRLLKTTDRGATWQAISPDLTRDQDWRALPLGTGFPRDSTTLSRDDGTSQYGNITTISESPRAPGTIFVGTDDGNVQLTTDGGARWTNLTARFRLAGAPLVSKVLASRHDARTAYVAFDGHTDDDLAPHLYRTTDGGATWTSIVGDLPASAPVKTLTEDPRNPDVLFAGTEFGLYWSFDGGRHWSFPGGGLPRVIVNRVVIEERGNDLLLGTHGRSVIVLDDARPLGERATAGLTLYPLRDATQRYQWRDQPFAGDGTFAAPNAPVGALVTYRLADDAGAARIEIRGEDGSLVRTLAGPGSAGTHRVLWDLRAQLPFVPAASDSGFYGAPQAPFVAPGTYTVTVRAGSATASQPVRVRSDPRSTPTPDAARARRAVIATVDSLSGAVAAARRQLAAADSEFTHLRALVAGRASPAVDSAVADVAARLPELRRSLASAYGTPIGEVFDVLGGMESSSAAPSESERRALAFAAADIRGAVETLRELMTTRMPRLRAAVATVLAAPAGRR